MTDWSKELYGGSNTPSVPQSPAFAAAQAKQPTDKGYKSNVLNTIFSTGGAVLGGIGGGIAGVAGGAMVPGFDLTGIPEAVGGYTGAVAGAGAGAGAGNGLADFIRGLSGDKSVNATQTLQNTPDQVKSGAAAEALGVPIAKGLGLVAHPIMPFINRVNTILDNSPKVTDMGKILNDFRTNELPKLYAAGHGNAAQAAYDDLTQRVRGMITAIKPHVPGNANTVGDIADMSIPVSQANEIKRSLYQLVGDNYGEIAKPNVEAIKGFAKLTKDQVAKAEPAISKYNAAASGLYKVPDTAKALTNIIGLGQPAAARSLQMITGAPTKAAQKVIPANGGYLRTLIPGLFQGGAQLNRQGQ